MRHRIGWKILLAVVTLAVSLVVGLNLWLVGSVQAATAATAETVVVIIDYKTQREDHRIMGTVVASRPLDGPLMSSWQFNGTFDGRPVTASGRVLEIWQTPTMVRMVCYELRSSFDWLLLLVREGTVRQDVLNLLQFRFRYPQWPNEPPRDETFAIAIDGWIHPPGQPGGQLVYNVTQVSGANAANSNPNLGLIKRPPLKLPGGTKPEPVPFRDRFNDILPWLLEH